MDSILRACWVWLPTAGTREELEHIGLYFGLTYRSWILLRYLMEKVSMNVLAGGSPCHFVFVFVRNQFLKVLKKC